MTDITDDIAKVELLSVDIKKIQNELMSIQAQANNLFGRSNNGRPSKDAADKAKEIARRVSTLTKDLMAKRAEVKKIQDDKITELNDKLSDEQKERLEKARRNIHGFTVSERK